MSPYGDPLACEHGIPTSSNNFSAVCRAVAEVMDFKFSEARSSKIARDFVTLDKCLAWCRATSRVIDKCTYTLVYIHYEMMSTLALSYSELVHRRETKRDSFLSTVILNARAAAGGRFSI